MKSGRWSDIEGKILYCRDHRHLHKIAHSKICFLLVAVVRVWGSVWFVSYVLIALVQYLDGQVLHRYNSTYVSVCVKCVVNSVNQPCYFRQISRCAMKCCHFCSSSVAVISSHLTQNNLCICDSFVILPTTQLLLHVYIVVPEQPVRQIGESLYNRLTRESSLYLSLHNHYSYIYFNPFSFIFHPSTLWSQIVHPVMFPYWNIVCICCFSHPYAIPKGTWFIYDTFIKVGVDISYTFTFIHLPLCLLYVEYFISSFWSFSTLWNL